MNNPQNLAYALFRIALGLNIFLHGASRLGSPYQKFIDWTAGIFKDSILPDFAVRLFAHSIPPLELTIGFFVLFGLFTLPALVAGTLVMISLMAGMCIVSNWEIVGIQLTYIFIYSVLLFAINYNGLSLDSRFIKKENL